MCILRERSLNSSESPAVSLGAVSTDASGAIERAVRVAHSDVVSVGPKSGPWPYSSDSRGCLSAFHMLRPGRSEEACGMLSHVVLGQCVSRLGGSMSKHSVVCSSRCCMGRPLVSLFTTKSNAPESMNAAKRKRIRRSPPEAETDCPRRRSWALDIGAARRFPPAESSVPPVKKAKELPASGLAPLLRPGAHAAPSATRPPRPDPLPAAGAPPRSGGGAQAAEAARGSSESGLTTMWVGGHQTRLLTTALERHLASSVLARVPESARAGATQRVRNYGNGHSVEVTGPQVAAFGSGEPSGSPAGAQREPSASPARARARVRARAPCARPRQ